MKWIIQEMLNAQENTERMLQSLKNTGTDFLLVKIEADETLTVLNPIDRLPVTDSQRLLDQFTQEDTIVIYGSKALGEIAERKNWTPGSLSSKWFDYQKTAERLGGELLNNDFLAGELWDLEFTEERVFVRPSGNNKLISGSLFTKSEFNEIKARERKGESPYTNQVLIISPLKKIYAEFRFFVVDHKIITGSSYRLGESVFTKLKLKPQLIEYTEKIIEQHKLSDAYVIDIAETEEGYKVMEYNNLSTSGLYSAEEEKIVRAVNQMKKYQGEKENEK